MASEVSLQVTMNRTTLPTMNSPQLVYALIDVQPIGAGASGSMPLNFGLILDRSGSMEGEKIENLRQAVKLVLGHMSAQDVVSVVLFDDRAELLVPSQPVTDGGRLQGEIDRITDRGGTEMSKGMRMGLDQIRANATPDRVSRMVLLTDGETWGDEGQCQQIASECGQIGIPISAFGLGDEWNSELLDTIAQNSGGIADYLDTPQKVLVEFERTLRRMQGTVVKHAHLTLRFVGGVTPRAAWRTQPQIAQLDAHHLSDRDVQLFLGDLQRDTGQTVVVELLLQPKPAGNYRIAQADVAYDVPGAAGGQHARQDLLLSFAENPPPQPPDPRVMNLVEKVSVFKLQTRALSEAQAGNVQGATQKLRAAATRLLNMGEADLAQAAQEEAANLEQQGQMSAAGTKKLNYGTRKLTQRLDELDGS